MALNRIHGFFQQQKTPQGDGLADLVNMLKKLNGGDIPLAVSSFANMQVILSGIYSSCTNTSTLDSAKNIEVLQ